MKGNRSQVTSHKSQVRGRRIPATVHYPPSTNHCKVVLFDIDGTLVNAGGCGIRALNRAIRDICGQDGICSKITLQGSTDKENFYNAYSCASGKKAAPKKYREISLKYLEYLPGEVRKSLKAGKYFRIRGVEKLLKYLTGRKDVLVGLGTGNLKQGAFIKLEPSGLLKYFSFGGYGCDSHVRSVVLKKAVARSRKLLKSAVRPCDVYVIGDTHKDVLAAKDAGYHAAAVTSGFGDVRLLERSGPELLIKDFSNIAPWLTWLGLRRDPKGVRRGAYICPDSPIEHAQYGRTGIDLKDVDDSIRQLRALKRRSVGKRDSRRA